jgi:hypothetical protein
MDTDAYFCDQMNTHKRQRALPWKPGTPSPGPNGGRSDRTSAVRATVNTILGELRNPQKMNANNIITPPVRASGGQVRRTNLDVLRFILEASGGPAAWKAFERDIMPRFQFSQAAVRCRLRQTPMDASGARLSRGARLPLPYIPPQSIAAGPLAVSLCGETRGNSTNFTVGPAPRGVAASPVSRRR